MQAEEVRLLYAYHCWANGRILTTAEQISDAQFVAPSAFPAGSLRGTLVHMMWAEWVWRMRMQEGISPSVRANEDEYATLAQLRSRWDEQEQQMQAFLASLRDEDITRPVVYASTQGVSYTNPLWHLLLQVFTHATQHRSEVAALLTSYGHSPGDLDFILFLREQQSVAQPAA